MSVFPEFIGKCNFNYIKKKKKVPKFNRKCGKSSMTGYGRLLFLVSVGNDETP